MTSGTPLHLGRASLTQRDRMRHNILKLSAVQPPLSLILCPMEIPRGFIIPQKAMARLMLFPKIPWQRPPTARVPTSPRPHSGFQFPVWGGDAPAEVSLLLSAMGEFAFVWLQIPGTGVSGAGRG